MANVETFLASQWYLAVVIVMIGAALAHGTMGFGFPVISTPMIALMTDLQTAVLVTLFPNLAVNLVSMVRGGNWRASLARHWPVAAFVMVGTIAGTQVLMLADPEPLKLLLAVMIVVYLQQKRLQGIDWSSIARHPRASGAAFGLLAGFLSGTVNVAVPPLVIYFMALGLPALAMTQVLNLCFLVGRSTQVAAFGLSGHLGLAVLTATASLTVVSVAALFVGLRLQSRIRPQVFQGILRKVLWTMALVLAVQVALHYAG